MIVSLCFVSCIVLEGVLVLYLESIISTQWILHSINWSLDLWIMWLSSLRLKVPWTKIEGHAQTNQTHVGTSLVNYKSSYDNGLHKSLVVFMLSSFLQQANEPHMGSECSEQICQVQWSYIFLIPELGAELSTHKYCLR